MLSPYQRLLQRVLIRVRPGILGAWLKQLLGVKREVIATAQGRFWIDPVSFLGIALSRNDSFEDFMIATLVQHLKPGGTFVDLGANEGYFTCIGARLCGPAGRVVGVEPQLRLLPVMAENLRLNALANAVIVNAAISDQPGTAALHLTADTNSGSSGLFRHTKYALPTQEVVTMTLEELLDQQGLQTVDLMKMDIEGFEYEAILGSRRVFEHRRIRALALELHSTILQDRGKDAADITDMLMACGYHLDEGFKNQVWTADGQSMAR